MQKTIIQCKMNGHLTELPCSASGCPLFGDCCARYQEYAQKQQTNPKGVQRIKQKIRIYLKCGLLVCMTAVGFLFTYAVMWILMGLPETWWAEVLLTVLSGLSATGLILWIGNEDRVPVRCGQCQYWTQHEPDGEIGTCFRRGF